MDLLCGWLTLRDPLTKENMAVSSGYQAGASTWPFAKLAHGGYKQPIASRTLQQSPGRQREKTSLAGL